MVILNKRQLRTNRQYIMNTFLPYSDFKSSAECLDYKRLGKQRVESWQIYLALTQKKYGWKTHPIVKMWKNHEKSLLNYGLTICNEWINRGYKDNMKVRFLTELKKYVKDNIYYDNPSWLGNEALHNSHKSNLLRKDKKFYSQYGWKVNDNLPYIWMTI